MPFAVYEKIRLSFPLTRHVHLQGWGEPLLHPRLPDMVRLAKDAGCRVSLTTNGEILKPDLSSQLLQERIDTIAISIAGATPQTHGWIRRGSDLERTIENVRFLVTSKKKKRRRKPRLVFSFLMTKPNIRELPDVVRLTKNLGADELVATNLDYTASKGHDELKIFDHAGPDPSFRHVIGQAESLASKLRLPFRAYPIQGEEQIICELNPLKIVSFSWDGKIGPCVYLNQTKRGTSFRLFRGERLEFSRLTFGDIRQHSFAHVWQSEDYRAFRRCFERRLSVTALAYDQVGYELDLGTRRELRRARRKYQEGMRENPLPEACNTCYKAYGF